MFPMQPGTPSGLYGAPIHNDGDVIFLHPRGSCLCRRPCLAHGDGCGFRPQQQLAEAARSKMFCPYAQVAYGFMLTWA